MAEAVDPPFPMSEYTQYGKHNPCLLQRIGGGRLPSHRIREFDISSAVHKAVPNNPIEFAVLKAHDCRKNLSKCVLPRSKFMHSAVLLFPTNLDYDLEKISVGGGGIGGGIGV